MKKTNILLKLAEKLEKKLAHQVNGQWHTEWQYGQFDPEGENVSGANGTEGTNSGKIMTDWHRHPMGTYFAEQYNGDRKPDGSPDI